MHVVDYAEHSALNLVLEDVPIRFVLRSVLSLLLASVCTARAATTQEADDCLYNDVHIQDFVANGPPLPSVLKMMEAPFLRWLMAAPLKRALSNPIQNRF